MEALVANGHNGALRHDRRGVTEVRADSSSGPTLMRYFAAMSQALGPMQWWPAKTPFEVIVGAILTQNTSWTNVERAISNLRSAQMLTPSTITSARLSKLALLRDSQLFNEFHALVVNTGKNWCRKKEPRCAECPLGSLLPATSPLSKIHSAARDTGMSQRTIA